MGWIFGATLALALVSSLASARLRTYKPQGNEDTFHLLVITNNIISMTDILITVVAPALVPGLESSNRLAVLYLLVLLPLSALNAYAFVGFVARTVAARLPKAGIVAYAVIQSAFFAIFLVALTRPLPILADALLMAFSATTAAIFLAAIVALMFLGLRLPLPARRVAIAVAASYIATLSLCAYMVSAQGTRQTSLGILLRPLSFIFSNIPALAILYIAKRRTPVQEAPSPPPAHSVPALGESYNILLSPREREIVACILNGDSNAQVAEKLFISVRTVDTHVANAYRKLGVKNRVQLLRLTMPA